VLKSDRWLKKNGKKIFTPFVEKQTASGKISYGVSSYGYDIRLAPEMKLFSNAFNGIVDPKNFDKQNVIELPIKKQDPFGDYSYFTLPSNSFSLGKSLEYVKMPRDCAALCIGKSTYARCGLIVNTTPIEPEWEGHITLEFSNTTNLPIKIYAYEGIAQLLFLQGGGCEISYKDRSGKYQNQKEITFPKMLK